MRQRKPLNYAVWLSEVYDHLNWEFSPVCHPTTCPKSITFSLRRKTASTFFCLLNILQPLLQSFSVDNFNFYFTVKMELLRIKHRPTTYQPFCSCAHVTLPSLWYSKKNCPGTPIKPPPPFMHWVLSPLAQSRTLLKRSFPLLSIIKVSLSTGPLSLAHKLTILPGTLFSAPFHSSNSSDSCINSQLLLLSLCSVTITFQQTFVPPHHGN